MYLPYNHRTVVANNLFIRTTGDPRALAGDLVRRIRAVDPDVPVSSVLTMDEQIDASLGRPRMLLVLLAGFAVLGVTLGAIGISGVVAWIVRQRRREIGIRVALGASPVGVAALVARTGILWAVLGIGIGIPAALGLSRLLRGLVFGVSTTDPITFLAVPFLLLLIAGIAGFVPATRAARVDPAAVLGE
jgi:ABC-type antimicrobial peptide transport system permease subunit